MNVHLCNKSKRIDSKNTFLEINDYSKVVRYKVNIQKSVAEQVEF